MRSNSFLVNVVLRFHYTIFWSYFSFLGGHIILTNTFCISVLVLHDIGTSTLCVINYFRPFIRPPLILYGWCCFFHYIKGGLIFLNERFRFLLSTSKTCGWVYNRKKHQFVCFFLLQIFIHKLIYKWKISEQGGGY